jgi:anti-anti-sigma factor
MKVTAENRPAGPALAVEGDVDHENVGQLITALQRVTDTHGPRIVLDLAQVTYVDSAGIGAIYGLVERVSGDGELELTGVSSNLWRIFEVAGLTARHGVRILPQRERQAKESSPAPPRPKGWGQAPPRTVTFTGRLDQLPRIRGFVGDVAHDAELDDERTFNLEVAVSEASANAIEHGLPQGDLQLSALCGDGRLTVTVTHPGRFLPRLGDDPSRRHRGMGLPLMLALTDEVLVSHPPGEGTRVSLSVYFEEELASI